MSDAPEKIWLLPAEGTLLQPGTTQQRDPWWDFDGAAWATETEKDADVEYLRADINALLVAAASKGEEPDLMLSEWRNALARAERAEEAFEIAKAHRDRLVSALRRQVQNIEHWLETGEPASPEESRSIYEQLKAALSGSSDPRKDVARRCVEIAQFHPNSVIGKLISEKIASEFSLDTKEGTDAGE